MTIASPERAGERLSTLHRTERFSRRNVGFGIFFAASLLVFWRPLVNLLSFSQSHDYASHIVLILPASVFLIYLKREQVFTEPSTDVVTASSLFLAGIVLWLGSKIYFGPLGNDMLPLEILAIVLFWISAFTLFFGAQAFAAARFPLLFLLLFVPIPETVINKIIFFLQTGSAWLSYQLFRLLSIPVYKRGFELHLPTLDLEVEKQCSGIRSSLALLISVLILGYFVLKSAWRRAILVFSILPILILKNALRIVTISLLSMYVDRRFLHGWLHTSGGIVFYLLGLLALVPIVSALRKSEMQGAQEFSDSHPMNP